MCRVLATLNSWEWNSNNQWPEHADDPPPMVEGGDLLLPAPVMEALQDILTTPFSEDSTELPARDDVPDLKTPPPGPSPSQRTLPMFRAPPPGTSLSHC